jgi:hypothetical protein
LLDFVIGGVDGHVAGLPLNIENFLIGFVLERHDLIAAGILRRLNKLPPLLVVGRGCPAQHVVISTRRQPLTPGALDDGVDHVRIRIEGQLCMSGRLH